MHGGFLYLVAVMDFATLNWPPCKPSTGYPVSGECPKGDGLNRRKDVELFETIRREYQFGVGTIVEHT
jgi:hypothetical protein